MGLEPGLSADAKSALKIGKRIVLVRGVEP
jgi:hypothetical protein